jgi:hypothetical protein
MIGRWRKGLRVDPVPALLASGNPAIEYFTQRDLLGEKVKPIETLWDMPCVERILRKQQGDGSWKYPGGSARIRSQEDYDQIETYRMLGELVEKYGLNRRHPQIRKAAEFLFRCQTADGDFRGIYGPLYSPNYSAGIMELLIKAGCGDDHRIEKGFDWLLSMRQDDGGWAIPMRTVRASYQTSVLGGEAIEPDRSRPFSHLVTGVVLRAFAAHPRYRSSKGARDAGALLASRFFKRDPYPDRGTPEYWGRVSYPFWFTDIVSALDSLSLMGFSKDDAQISRALEWLSGRQSGNGLFKLKLLRGKDKDLIYWVCLAVCRIFERLI